MVHYLLEHGACIFATTALEKKTPYQCCDRGIPGYLNCTKYLFGERWSYLHMHAKSDVFYSDVKWLNSQMAQYQIEGGMSRTSTLADLSAVATVSTPVFFVFLFLLYQ